MLKGALFFSALAALAPIALAQKPLYAQCGGTGYSGDTTCVAGAVCTVVNQFYSQCLPGTVVPIPPVTPTPTQSVPVVIPTPTVPANPGLPPTPESGNPFQGYDLYLSPYYAEEVVAAAAQISDPTLKAKALKVKDIPTYIWFDVVRKTPDLGKYLADASNIQRATGRKQLVQIVVYDLPDRDCAAAASNGEFHLNDGGMAKYKNYVDLLVAEVRRYPDVRVVAVVEPDSLANLVTNMNVTKCRGAEAAYKEGVVYALRQLSSVGVYSYIDAGHAGWLGWKDNLAPSGRLFSQIYKDAGSSGFIRGIATNVANYNSLSTNNRDPITKDNDNWDEVRYINALSPLLRQNGWNAQFIVDQGRSGVQNIRQEWGNWCNVRGAGFGMRPTLSTPLSAIDAIVWVKPGGEADGTSDTSAVRYDTHCGKSDAHKPAPEAGTWFQEYFVALVQNANPPL
ncbi:exocellobiohydrolase [Coprinopsis marcescibilis]|uniref:Glucanase n=1 Tax=Coprinopsis marcescibilis TaxID=230819 RepID=A0A5C3LB87_COPMA|nr:exocellobiohydrolase [Coprinopsis marcescibilis]